MKKACPPTPLTKSLEEIRCIRRGMAAGAEEIPFGDASGSAALRGSVALAIPRGGEAQMAESRIKKLGKKKRTGFGFLLWEKCFSFGALVPRRAEWFLARYPCPGWNAGRRHLPPGWNAGRGWGNTANPPARQAASPPAFPHAMLCVGVDTMLALPLLWARSGWGASSKSSHSKRRRLRRLLTRSSDRR